MKKIFFSAVVLFAASAAGAQVKVEQPWSRATAASAPNGAVFMNLTNPQGSVPDRLIAAESPVASAVELHNHIMDGNVMRMRKVDGIDVKPGETVKLEPTGYHVMLLGLKGPLKEGEGIPLTLVFSKAGRVDIKAEIMKPGATMPGMGGAMHQHMQHAPAKSN